MRKLLAVAVSVIALFGFIAPASAQAPAPKVTINGLLDFVTTGYHNWSGTTGSIDSTRSDEGWYSRERGVFTFTGEIGKTKAVWAVENDLGNGAGLLNSGNAFNGGTNGTAMSGVSANFDMDTDVASVVETKWLYLETPLTGPGSLMPFIPVSSIIRAGGQPARGHEYKVGILLGGDFPGVAIETTWAPNMRSTLTYVQIAESLDKFTAPGQNESQAILASLEWDVFKGLTVKPTYAYAHYTGGNCGTANLGMEVKDGFNPNNCTPTTTGGRLQTNRHTIGGDVRWTAGPFSLQPTFLYQFGTQEITPVALPGRVAHSVDINTWIFDTTAGFRTGPLNVEGRFMWTPGMDAQHKVANGADVGYYQSIDAAFAYMAGWTEIQTAGVDYITAFQSAAPGISLRQSPSYDKYGRIFVALATDYSLTPALTLHGLVNFSWTDKDVDTDGAVGTTGRLSTNRGDHSYLGTELNAGFTYRFAPNVAFDGIYAYMWTGSALDQPRSAGGVVEKADDVWKAVARMRVTF
jgi:hypothetical protein